MFEKLGTGSRRELVAALSVKDHVDHARRLVPSAGTGQARCRRPSLELKNMPSAPVAANHERSRRLAAAGEQYRADSRYPAAPLPPCATSVVIIRPEGTVSRDMTMLTSNLG